MPAGRCNHKHARRKAARDEAIRDGRDIRAIVVGLKRHDFQDLPREPDEEKAA